MKLWRSPGVVRLAKLAVSGVLIATVIWQVGPNAVIPERVSWRHLLFAVLLFGASNLLGAYQWNLLLRCVGIDLTAWRVARAYFVGLFFNNFLIGSVGGDVLRAIDLRRSTPEGSNGRTATGVATIVMDRFLGFFTMMWYAGAAAWLVGKHGRVARSIVALLLGFVALGILLTSRRLGTRADALVTRLLPANLAETVVNLRIGFVAMRRRYRTFFAATFISALVQGIRILVHYECALAVGVDAPLVSFFTFIPLVGVAAAIPISTGGLGTREWAAVGLFGTIGVPGAGVVAMELFAHAAALASALPGAFAFATLGETPRAVPAMGQNPQAEGT